ncbi:hypothetical protein [Rhodococcus sp. NPDC058521]|uniref:hypothetical protein n=1 Tax=Rhodococcus sp. NPDC058521 TaxID=3346536 RepID=UPI00365DF829
MTDRDIADLEPAAGFLLDPEQALDRGAVGLEYFEQFLPAARRIGVEHREYPDYCAKYDVERGLDLSTLEGDADIVEAAAGAARSAADEHGVAVYALSSAWWDGAGAEASAFAARIRDRATASAEQLTSTAEAFAELPNTLAQAVQTKAFEVASLHESTVAGYTAPQVDVLVEIAELAEGSPSYRVESLVADAARWCPAIATAAAKANSDGGDLSVAVAEAARGWLRDSFAPCYIRVRDLFDDACTRCTEAVRSAYRAVSDEAQKIALEEFPVPGSFVQQPSAPPTVSAPEPSPTVPSYREMPTSPESAGAPTTQPTPPGPAGPGFSHNAESTAPAAHDAQPPTPPSSPGTTPGSVQPGGGYNNLDGIGPLPGNAGLSGLLENGLLNGGFPNVGSFGTSGLGDLGSVGSGLSSLIGDVRSLVEPVIGDVVSAITTHGEDESENDVDADDDSAADEGDAPEDAAGHRSEDVKSLELKSDGKTWTLALEDGGISLKIDDVDGESTEYGIELGPDGVPRIVVSNESDCAADESGDAEVANADGGHTGVGEGKVVEESIGAPAPVDEPEVAHDAGVAEPPMPAQQTSEPPLPETPMPETRVPDAPVDDAAEPELATVSPEPGAAAESPSQVAGNSETAGLESTPDDDGDSGAELAEAGPL